MRSTPTRTPPACATASISAHRWPMTKRARRWPTPPSARSRWRAVYGMISAPGPSPGCAAAKRLVPEVAGEKIGDAVLGVGARDRIGGDDRHDAGARHVV